MHALKQKLKSIIQGFFLPFNLELVRKNSLKTISDSRSTTHSALQSLKRRGYKINTVIDIGASDGRWSKDMMKFFPETHYYLIEAQSFHKEALDRFVQKNLNSKYVLAAAGNKAGKIYFDAGNPFGGQASYTPFPSNNIEVPVTTVDLEVEKNKLTGPFLIKFDTHGFEVPILNGAIQTLKKTSVIIMECYLHRLTKEGLIFNEMCNYLDQLGFRCIDMVDPAWRVYDDTFWQMDLIFIQKDSAEFTYNDYE